MALGNLPKDKVIHHTNFDYDDNRIENLSLVTEKEHSYIHHNLDKEEIICGECGKKFLAKRLRKSKVRFCSPRCSRRHYFRENYERWKLNPTSAWTRHHTKDNREYHKEYYKKNKETIKLKERQRRQINIEEYRIRAKKYRLNNIEIIREKDRIRGKIRNARKKLLNQPQPTQVPT